MIRLVPDHYRRMPWRNGGGVTTEIARRDGANGELDWRVSIAEVAADGPFSQFPDCDRVILVIEGAGMVLSHAAGARTAVLGPLEPYAFAGDIDTHCALRAGPVRDFNLMVRRGRWRGDVTVVQAGAAEGAPLPEHALLVHCLHGHARVHGDREEATLAAGETLIAEHATRGLERARGLEQPALLVVVTLAERGDD